MSKSYSLNGLLKYKLANIVIYLYCLFHDLFCYCGCEELGVFYWKLLYSVAQVFLLIGQLHNVGI